MKLKTIASLVLLTSSFMVFAQNTGNTNDNWTCYTDDKGLLVDDHQIKGVFEHTDGNLWFVTDRGINIYDGEEWAKLDKDNKLMRKSLGAFLVDRKGHVWIGTGSPEFYFHYYGTGPMYKGGLLVYDGKEWKTILTKDIGIKVPIVTQLFEQSNGDIWVGVSNVDSGMETRSLASRGAILRYSEGEWSVFKYKDLPCLNCEYVKGFYEDKNQRLWLWGLEGITFFDQGKFHRVSKQDGYLRGGRRITAVFEDSQQNFWVAGPGRAARYDGTSWTTFIRSNGLPSSDHFPLGFLETTDNKIFLSITNGLYEFDGVSTWERKMKRFLSAKAYNDENNRFWLPTHKGLEILDHGDRKLDKDLGRVREILKDNKGGIWVFSAKNGAKRFKDGKWAHFNKKNQLPSDKLRFSHITDNGTIWIATNKGICKCEYTE